LTQESKKSFEKDKKVLGSAHRWGEVAEGLNIGAAGVRKKGR
jgi:hypothetical protein